MRKPYDTTTRQCVEAVHTLNGTLEELLPAFTADQKIPATDFIDILASSVPNNDKELMTGHGFDPQTATTKSKTSSKYANVQRQKKT
jgi:transcriptional regulator of met regulon